MFSRGLGSIPGSVLFGAIIDSACIFHESSCNAEKGSCLLYSKNHLSTYLFIVSAFFKLATLLLFVAAKQCYKAPPSLTPLPSLTLSPVTSAENQVIEESTPKKAEVVLSDERVKTAAVSESGQLEANAERTGESAIAGDAAAGRNHTERNGETDLDDLRRIEPNTQ